MTLAFPDRAPRVHGGELLDDPTVDPAIAVRSLADVARSNRWFGGTNAVLAELAPELAAARARGRAAAALTLLDVGTGLGDVPAGARAAAHRAGVRLTTIGLEITLPLAIAGRPGSGEATVGNALHLPFADASVDIVTCSQLLHHFDVADATILLAELTRVARRRVIVADLRRAWGAIAGIWTASWLLGFHPISRHDGIVSIRRGFRVSELDTTVRDATGCAPHVRNRRGFRVTASWTPEGPRHQRETRAARERATARARTEPQ